jgi:hypothetical protein
MRRDTDIGDAKPRTRRRTIGSIRKKRISNIIIIPTYLFIILFLMVPGLLVILELGSRLFLESKALGILSIISGFFLGFIFVLRLISFRESELDILRDLVVVFLAFILFISIGRAVTENSTGMGQILHRYKSSFKTYFKMLEEGDGKSKQRTSEASVYSNIDSMSMDMAMQPCIIDFFAYASEMYYQDLDSYINYLGVNEVMSLYRVMLEEFEVMEDASDDLHQPDPKTIIEDRAGSHTQLTLFFTACLMQFDYKLDIIECVNGNLVNMVRINPGYYPHFLNFIHQNNLNQTLTWYMQEQMIPSESGFFHWVPLYIPVYDPAPPSPYGKFALQKTRTGSVS